jgi:hypothetical protein
MNTQRFTVIVTAALLLLAATGPLLAQWPTVLMFYGGALKQPVFVTGADSASFGDAFRFPSPGQQGVTAKDMGDRPYVSVACFWGPREDPAINGVRSLTELKPEMAWQHGRFYPATKDKPAMFFVTMLTKNRGGRGVPVPTDDSRFVGGPVSASALALMKKVGVPVGPVQ